MQGYASRRKASFLPPFCLTSSLFTLFALTLLASVTQQAEKPQDSKASDLALEKRLFNDSKRQNETPKNAKNKKTTDGEELEYLCHHFYKDEFVASAEVLEAGCQLECVLLQASGKHGQQFFDTSVTKFHNLNEGLECAPRKVGE